MSSEGVVGPLWSFDSRIEYIEFANSRGGRTLMFGRYVALRDQWEFYRVQTVNAISDRRTKHLLCDGDKGYFAILNGEQFGMEKHQDQWSYVVFSCFCKLRMLHHIYHWFTTSGVFLIWEGRRQPLSWCLRSWRGSALLPWMSKTSDDNNNNNNNNNNNKKKKKNKKNRNKNSNNENKNKQQVLHTTYYHYH